MRRRTMLTCAASLAAVFAFSGYGFAQEATPETATGTSGDTYIRFIHVAPDAGPVDVYLDGGLFFEGLDFESYTNFFGEIPSGSYLLELRTAGASADEEPVYAAEGVEIVEGLGTTLIVKGLLEGEGTLAFSATTYPTTQEEVALVEGGGAELELAHFADGVDGVDLLVDGELLLENVLYNQILWAAVEQGDYTVGVAPTGSTDVLVEDTLTIEASTVNSLIAFLDENGEPAFLLAQSFLGEGMMTQTEATPEATEGA